MAIPYYKYFWYFFKVVGPERVFVMWILSKDSDIYIKDKSWIVKNIGFCCHHPQLGFTGSQGSVMSVVNSFNHAMVWQQQVLPPYRPQDSKVAVSVVRRQTLPGEKTISIYYFTSIRRIQFFSPQILKYTAQIDKASFSQRSQGVCCLVLEIDFGPPTFLELIWSSHYGSNGRWSKRPGLILLLLMLTLDFGKNLNMYLHIMWKSVLDFFS